MLVLVVDTSTPVVTAGVVTVLRPHEIVDPANVAGVAKPPQPVGLLAERTRSDAFGHAEYLMPLVSLALDQARSSLAQVEAVVVGLGPGPFTGLRVGIATAQALGDALSVPVHGVPSHDGVALAGSGVTPAGAGAGSAARSVVAVAPRPSGDPLVAGPAGDFLVATDARRREVYVSGYRDRVRRIGPLVGAPADLAARLPETSARPGWSVRGRNWWRPCWACRSGRSTGRSAKGWSGLRCARWSPGRSRGR